MDIFISLPAELYPPEGGQLVGGGEDAGEQEGDRAREHGGSRGRVRPPCRLQSYCFSWRHASLWTQCTVSERTVRNIQTLHRVSIILPPHVPRPDGVIFTVDIVLSAELVLYQHQNCDELHYQRFGLYFGGEG